MRITNHERGLTLIESLISILLLSTLLIGILGAFFISKSSTVRAKHRTIAMSIIREHMEKEVSRGFGNDPDYYVTFDTGDAQTRVVDGVTYTITPQPFPAVVNSEGGSNGVSYKVIGFLVSWPETFYGGSANEVTCNERALTYVARHN